MQQHRFGQTDSLSYQPLQPDPEGEMFPFNLLHLYFANGMLFGLEIAIVHICPLGIETTNAAWCS